MTKQQKKICLFISVLLTIVGVAILWSSAGWRVAAGVFVLIWANNIGNEINRK